MDEFGQLLVDSLSAGGERHVHKFAFGVHLEAALDACIDFVLNGELLAFVVWISLESSEDFALLAIGELFCRDNGDLLFFVKLLVELLVLESNLFQVDQTLVLRQDGQEVQSHVAELGSLKEGLIQLSDFSGADTLVLGEKSE